MTLCLFGPPRIERDDVLVEVDTRKAIALIAFLAVTGQAHSRDALAALLWPDADQASARAALRRTLSTLNKALAGEALDIDRESIGLRRDANLWVDVDEFRRHLTTCRRHGHATADVCTDCLEPLSRAVHLYRDHFLAGFSLRDSPEFDDWQFFQSEGLRRELAGALERIVRCQAAQGDFETAIGHARRWLALDPLHEPAHRELIQLYALAGQRAAALRQYRECVRVLEEELGVPPLAETTRLSEAIKENREVPRPVVERADSQPAPATDRSGPDDGRDADQLAVSAPVPPRQQVATLPGSYPLVGRAAEWDALMRLYGAIGDDGYLVVVEGEAGIGKTRLVEALVDYARARGATTIAARCYEGETNLAYGPIIAGLRDAARQLDRTGRLSEVPVHWLSEVARLLPDVSDARSDLPPAPALDNPGAQSRFFEGVSRLFWTALRGPPAGVFLIDDLHWADAATLDLLTYLLRRLRDHPVMIVVTWRDEHQANSSHLRQVVAESQRDGMATTIRLARLDQAAVRELAESIIGMRADFPGHTAAMVRVADIGDRLFRETEGLPFFVVEYLAAMARDESPMAAADWSLPGGARDLLRARLAAVSQTAWQLLTTAAVIGRSFDFDTLREASGRSDDETVSALEELVARGLVGESRTGPSATGSLDATRRSPAYDFGHEKLRTFVYDETSLVRRRLLHRRVAEAHASRARGPRELGTVAGQIAQHYRLAGLDSEAAEYFQLAGEHARSLYANAEALAHLNLALALGHADTAGLHEAIGDLQVLRGDYGAAITSFETAAAQTTSAVPAGIEHKLGNVHQRLGEWDLAESHFQAALTSFGEAGSTGDLAHLYADWSLAAHQRGQSDRALAMAREALDLASTTSNARALAQVHNILGILVSRQGDVETARDHLRQSLNLADELGDPGIRAAALNNLALATGASGDVEQALALAEAALALCVSLGDRHREAAVHNNLADLLHAARRSDEAMFHLKKAVTIFAEIGQDAGAFQPAIWKLAEW